MGSDGLSELLIILEDIQKSLQKWGKHTNTVHLLADQIMGLERYEKERLMIPKDSYTAVQCTIQYKITEEMKRLSEVLGTLETDHETLASIINKMESVFQTHLDDKQSCSPATLPEIKFLQPAYSLYNHLSIIISMKMFPLYNADVDNFKSLQDFKLINQATKSMETELEKILSKPE